jgi:hypothetical protein
MIRTGFSTLLLLAPLALGCIEVTVKPIPVDAKIDVHLLGPLMDGGVAALQVLPEGSMREAR